ncbi:MAG: GNAT family N-acetyltransferase [Dehalococcoidia bacterium]
MRTPMDYLQLQLSTLFVRDAAGRLLRVNERSNVNIIPPAPRVFFGRTPLGNVWACRADLPEDLCLRLESLLAAEPVLSTYEAPPSCRQLLYDLVAEREPVTLEEAGPAFSFPATIPAPAGVVPVTSANDDLLSTHFPDVLADLETSQPCVAVLKDGLAVSVCFSARITAEAAEAGLHTALSARRRGYAAAVTAGWALAVRERGRIPLYSTAWDNHASRAVARRLGLILYGSDWHIT